MRRNWKLLGLLLVIPALPSLAPGQEAEPGEAVPEEGIRVERSAIARAVEEREPIDDGTSFPAEVGELYCFTEIAGAGAADGFVFHVWRHGSKEMARVRLAVRGASWRTWSSKRILPSWTGDWKVEVEDAEGNVLKTLSFTVGDDEPAGDA